MQSSDVLIDKVDDDFRLGYLVAITISALKDVRIIGSRQLMKSTY